MTNRPTTILSFVASAVVITSMLISIPASAVETPPPIQNPRDDSTQPFNIRLDRPESLADAMDQGALLNEVVVGYHFANPGIEGEFFPTRTNTSAAFLKKFSRDFATSPQITGIVVKRTFDPSTRSFAPGPLAIKAPGEEFRAPPPSGPKVKMLRNAGSLSGNKSATASHADIQTSGLALEDDPPASTAWVPDEVSVDINKGSEPLDNVQINQLITWSTSSPEDIPDTWGLEAEINAYNPDVEGGLRPFCINPLFYTQFFAINSYFGWTVSTTTSEAEPSPDLQAYGDTDIADACSRSAFSVGLRYPQNIPANSSGVRALSIEIDALPGLVPENAIDAYLQLVDDHDCSTPASIPLAYCMGNALDSPLTVGVAESAAVLSTDRAWFAPDRCWTTVDFGARTIPSQACGQPESLAGIPATYLSIAGGAGHRILTLENVPSPAIPMLSVPPVEPFASRFNYAYSDWRLPTSEGVSVQDLRMWADGEELSIQSDPWADWKLEADPAGHSFKLVNFSGAVTIGDDSRSVLRNFAQDGTISFRINGEAPNYFRIQDLEDSVTVPAYEAENRTVGLPPDALTSGEFQVRNLNCSVMGACISVGSYPQADYPHRSGLIVLQSGSSMASIEAPLPSDAASIAESSVGAGTCWAAGACVVMGTYRNTSGEHVGFIDRLSSGTWVSTVAPMPTEASASPAPTYTSLICPSSSRCIAIGTYLDEYSKTKGLINTFSSATWTALEAPVPEDAYSWPDVRLTALSCASTAFCVAVGNYLIDSDGAYAGFTATLDEGDWVAEEMPLPSNSGSGNTHLVELRSVDCPAVGVCVAVGGYLNEEGWRLPLLLELSGGTWSGTQAPSPADARLIFSESEMASPYYYLSSVSCGAVGSCVAVGQYYTTTYGNTGWPLVESLTDGDWVGTAGVLPEDVMNSPPQSPNAQFLTVACPGAGRCVAVGWYGRSDYGESGVVASLVDGIWTNAYLPKPADSLELPFSWIGWVSCASTSCMTLGSYITTEYESPLLFAELSPVF